MPTSSRPLYLIEPPITAFGSLIRPTMLSSVTVLPQPDSPTTLTISCELMVKETPLTARTNPCWVRKETLRSFTSSRDIVPCPAALSAAYAGVEDCIGHIHHEIRADHEERRVDDGGQDHREIQALQRI